MHKLIGSHSVRAACFDSPLNFNRNICLSSEPLERRVYRFKIWLVQIVCLWAHKLTSCSFSRMQESVQMCTMCFRHYILFKLQIEHRIGDELRNARIPTPDRKCNIQRAKCACSECEVVSRNGNQRSWVAGKLYD